MLWRQSPHLSGRRGEELQNKPLGTYELLWRQSPHLSGRRGEELRNEPLDTYELLCCDMKLQSSIKSLCFAWTYFCQVKVTGLLSCHCASFACISDNTKNLSFYQILVYIEIEKDASGDGVPFSLLLSPHVVSEGQIVLALMLFASSPWVLLEGQGVLALRLWGWAGGFENFSEDPVAQPFASTGFIDIQALLKSRLVSIFGFETAYFGEGWNLKLNGVQRIASLQNLMPFRKGSSCEEKECKSS